MMEAVENVHQKFALIVKARNYNFEPDVTKLKKHYTGITRNLTTLFAFLNWTYMIPYKINYSNETSTFIIKSSTFKKVVIWGLQVVLSMYHAVALVEILGNNSSVENLMKCVILSSLTCWSNMVLILLWKNRNRFTRIMARLDMIALQLTSRGASFKKGITSAVPLTLICLGCVCLSLLEVIFISLKLHQEERLWKPYLIMTEKSDNLRAMFPGLESLVLGRLLICAYGFTHVLANKLYYFSISHFGYAVLLVMCTMTGELYRALNSTIPEEFNSKSEVDETITMYTTIRSFTIYVNGTIGTLMAWGVLAHLPYNAYKMVDLLFGEPITQMSYLIHVMMYLAILVAGANVHSQINIFMDKLACTKLAIQDASIQARVSLLLHQSKWAGIRGGSFFLLTYGFLGNIVGVILTYAILVVQFQQK